MPTVPIDRSIDAVVFDLDGLVFNTEHLFHAASRELLSRRGLELPERVHRAMMGRRSREAYTILVEEVGLEEPLEDVIEETRAIFHASLDEHLAPMPGLFELLEVIEDRRLPKAIATSSHRTYMEDVLGRFDLLGRFSPRLTAEDVLRGKPDPEIYVTAARWLGVSPERMLVLEDSEIGSRAAAAAGAVVVSVPHEHSRHMDFSVATHVARGLGDPTIPNILDGTS